MSQHTAAAPERHPFQLGPPTLHHGLVLPDHGDPRSIVALARRAEQSGFSFVVLTDRARGPAAWPLVGAVATAAPGIDIEVHAAPYGRTNPLLLAQHAATAALLVETHLRVVLDTGRRLDAPGARWPDREARIDALARAVVTMRDAFAGTRDGAAEHPDQVVGPRPESPVGLHLRAGTERVARLAASRGDGLWIDPWSPESALEEYREAGGAGTVTVELAVASAPTRQEAVSATRQRFAELGVDGAALDDAESPSVLDELLGRASTARIADRLVWVGGASTELETSIAKADDRGVERVALRPVTDDPDDALGQMALELGLIPSLSGPSTFDELADEPLTVPPDSIRPATWTGAATPRRDEEEDGNDWVADLAEAFEAIDWDE